jgi:hypothetical protein
VAINGDPTRSHILDLEAHDIAASKFAVDGKVEHGKVENGKVEHGKVACSALELQPLPLFQGVRPTCCAVILKETWLARKGGTLSLKVGARKLHEYSRSNCLRWASVRL